jgi:hypothetical protein
MLAVELDLFRSKTPPEEGLFWGGSGGRLEAVSFGKDAMLA